MRHAPIRPARSLALALSLVLGLAVSAAAQPTPTPNPIYVCAGKIVGVKGLRDYTNNLLLRTTKCALDRLKGNSCVPNLSDLNDDLKKEVEACQPDALDALCPLGSDTQPEIQAALHGNSPTSVKSQLLALVDDLFFTPNDACPRPAAPVSSSSKAYACADKIRNAISGQETVERLEQCFFSCERPRLQTSGLEICTDDVDGEPIKEQVIECERTKLEDGLDLLDSRCDAAAIQELGCPLGAESLSGLKSKLSARLTTFVRELNRGIFHSPCRGNLPTDQTEPVPAEVTLEPSLTKKQVTCGQTIDAAFMGTDKVLSFDTDLDCSSARVPAEGAETIDGIIIAKSRLTVNGRLKTRSIRGPSRSSLRTGTGIRLAPGASRIQIKNFKAIENWGVGIEDAEQGNNKKLVIFRNTVRRNLQAGIRLRSQRATIDKVVADKNGIGLDLSGKGTRVRATQAKGSLYEPKVGIRLSGVDTIWGGPMVRVVGPGNVIELNQGPGILIVEGGHVVSEGNQIRSNGGPGILIEALGTGSVIDTNNVKNNGQGIVVEGDANLLDTNTCEQNLGAGFVIGGIGNVLLNNKSGKKTELGNGEQGYLVTGQGVSMQNNRAEANLGSGFVLTDTSSTTLFKDNVATDNFEHGFDIQSSGNTFATCNAERNNASHPENDTPAGERFHEWLLVEGNLDGSGNKAGGGTIHIPAGAAFCDKKSDCP